MIGILAVNSVQRSADLAYVPLDRRQPVRILCDGARTGKHDVEVRRLLQEKTKKEEKASNKTRPTHWRAVSSLGSGREKMKKEAWG